MLLSKAITYRLCTGDLLWIRLRSPEAAGIIVLIWKECLVNFSQGVDSSKINNFLLVSLFFRINCVCLGNLIPKLNYIHKTFTDIPSTKEMQAYPGSSEHLTPRQDKENYFPLIYCCPWTDRIFLFQCFSALMFPCFCWQCTAINSEDSFKTLFSTTPLPIHLVHKTESLINHPGTG